MHIFKKKDNTVAKKKQDIMWQNIADRVNALLLIRERERKEIFSLECPTYLIFILRVLKYSSLVMYLSVTWCKPLHTQEILTHRFCVRESSHPSTPLAGIQVSKLPVVSLNPSWRNGSGCAHAVMPEVGHLNKLTQEWPKWE